MKVGTAFFEFVSDLQINCNFASIINLCASSYSKTMGRKFFVGGNWKMNGLKTEIDGIVAFLKAGPLDPNVGMFFMYIVI